MYQTDMQRHIVSMIAGFVGVKPDIERFDDMQYGKKSKHAQKEPVKDTDVFAAWARLDGRNNIKNKK